MNWLPLALVVGGAILFGKKKRRPAAGGFEGIIVHPEKLDGVCKCIKGTRLCFAKGVVGALNEEQKKKLCKHVEWVIPGSEVARLPLRELLEYVTVLEKKVEELEKELEKKEKTK